MIPVDSDALRYISLALGVTRQGASETTFTDGSLEQTFDVAGVIRRGRTIADSHGFFTALMRNIHGAADTQTSTVQPYRPGNPASIAPFPANLPLGFDIWLISASLTRLSGTGTVTACMYVTPPATMQGIGIDSTGAGAVGAERIPMVYWDSTLTQTIEFGVYGSLPIWRPIGLRVPRSSTNDTTFLFSSTASAIATWDCQLLLGVFPIGAGQDAAV